MRPTVYGEALVGHARAVVAEIRRAREHLTGLRQGQDGTVTVGTLLAGANVLLPRAVARLKQERPRLTIVVREGTPDVLHSALLGGELDLIVGRVGSAADDALRQRMLYREPIRLAVRAGHPLLTEGPAGGTDALAHPWILPVELPSVGRTVGVTEAAHPTRTPVLEAFLRHFDEEAALLRASLGAGAQGRRTRGRRTCGPARSADGGRVPKARSRSPAGRDVQSASTTVVGTYRTSSEHWRTSTVRPAIRSGAGGKGFARMRRVR
ncbi:LysR family transcriptional regulator [Streptomyces cinereoruber]|uniref:LysR family transcriptional regulator n=1 Tax=Streptomyces cinereoruber TaxID=67260 RepID=UPI00369D8CB3